MAAAVASLAEAAAAVVVLVAALLRAASFAQLRNTRSTLRYPVSLSCLPLPAGRSKYHAAITCYYATPTLYIITDRSLLLNRHVYLFRPAACEKR